MGKALFGVWVEFTRKHQSSRSAIAWKNGERTQRWRGAVVAHSRFLIIARSARMVYFIPSYLSSCQYIIQPSFITETSSFVGSPLITPEQNHVGTKHHRNKKQTARRVNTTGTIIISSCFARRRGYVTTRRETHTAYWPRVVVRFNRSRKSRCEIYNSGCGLPGNDVVGWTQRSNRMEIGGCKFCSSHQL